MQAHLKVVGWIFLVLGAVLIAFSIWDLKTGMESHGELKILGLLYIPFLFIPFWIFQTKELLEEKVPKDTVSLS